MEISRNRFFGKLGQARASARTQQNYIVRRVSLREGQEAQVPRSAGMRASGLHPSYIFVFRAPV